MRVTSYPAEWLALVEGVKPALRLWRDRPKAAAEASAARARGFAVETVDLPGDPPRTIVYVARTPAAARNLRALEAPILPGRGVRALTVDDLAAHRGLGEALGFPACCVDGFLGRVARGVTRLPSGTVAHEDFVAATIALSASGRLDARCNIFAAGRNSCWLSHVPCALDCAASITYATAVRAAYARRSPAAVAQLDHDLALDVAIGRDGRRGKFLDADADACRLPFAMGLDPARGLPVRSIAP